MTETCPARHKRQARRLTSPLGRRPVYGLLNDTTYHGDGYFWLSLCTYPPMPCLSLPTATHNSKIPGTLLNSIYSPTRHKVLMGKRLFLTQSTCPQRTRYRSANIHPHNPLLFSLAAAFISDTARSASDVYPSCCGISWRWFYP